MDVFDNSASEAHCDVCNKFHHKLLLRFKSYGEIVFICEEDLKKGILLISKKKD